MYLKGYIHLHGLKMGYPVVDFFTRKTKQSTDKFLVNLHFFECLKPTFTILETVCSACYGVCVKNFLVNLVFTQKTVHRIS